VIVELLTLGDELLDGRRVDTNTAWIGRALTAMGAPPRFRQTVTDRSGDIEEAFRRALGRADVVISTGGLGPTADDITIEALGKALGRGLEFHHEIWEKIRRRFEARKLRPTDSNRKQAFLPAGGREIPNDHGTAPGCIVEEAGKLVFCLPGPPREMNPLFDLGVRPELERKLGVLGRRTERIYHFVGLPESYVEEAIDRCELGKIPGGEIRIAYTESFPFIDVTLSILPEQPDKSDEMAETADRTIRKEMGAYLIATGADTAEACVIDGFRKAGLKLAVAESMTGGLLSGRLVDVAGSSDVLDRGFIVYSNESKVELLGVSEETLKTVGAVSEACALEMASGARKRARTDVGVSTTGIAGPSGGAAEKPVGLTYVAWVGPDFEEVKRYQFRWDRNRNRMMAVYEALRGLIRVSGRIRAERKR
jgi:nicotinamide-nucleotide amidase